MTLRKRQSGLWLNFLTHACSRSWFSAIRSSRFAFDVGGVRIHSNLRGEEDNLEELVSDKVLTEAVCKAGFSPFGRPSGGGYDRVCFDLRKGGRPMDAPVVVLDHESILSGNRIPKPRTLASGLNEIFRSSKSG